MISEERLQTAAQAVCDCMVAGISPVPHEFSPGFQRKMTALTRRADHAIRYWAMRSAAAVLLAIVTALGTLMVASPQVQASVIGWVHSIAGPYFHYHTDEQASGDMQYGYCLPENFEGYTLLSVEKKGTSLFYMYTNADGQLLQFSYLQGVDAENMYLNV